MMAALEAAGVSPAWIYASQYTGGLLPRLDGSFVSERDRAEWDEAIDRYMKLHQPGGRVDHDAEMGKLQNVLVGVMLGMLADDVRYAASLASRMGAPSGSPGDDESLIQEHLHHWSNHLMDILHSD